MRLMDARYAVMRHLLRLNSALLDNGMFGKEMKKWFHVAFITLGMIAMAVLAWPWIWIFGNIAYGKVDEWRYARTESFNPQRWRRPNLKYRYAVMTEVKENRIKPGMDQAAVRELLGPPDSVGADGGWQYDTRRPGWRLIDFSGGGILVRFTTDGKVSEAVDNRWVD